MTRWMLIVGWLAFVAAPSQFIAALGQPREVTALAYDERTNLTWIGSSGGLRIDGEYVDVERVHAIEMMETASVAWVSTSAGVYRVALGSQSHNIELKVPGIEATDVAIARDDSIWIGTMGSGVLHYDPDSGASAYFGELDGLPSDSILNISASANGCIWVGTPVGLAAYDGARWTKETTFERQWIYGVVELGDRLVVGTSEGIYSGLIGSDRPMDACSLSMLRDLLVAGLTPTLVKEILVTWRKSEFGSAKGVETESIDSEFFVRLADVIMDPIQKEVRREYLRTVDGVDVPREVEVSVTTSLVDLVIGELSFRVIYDSDDTTVSYDVSPEDVELIRSELIGELYSDRMDADIDLQVDYWSKIGETGKRIISAMVGIDEGVVVAHASDGVLTIYSDGEDPRTSSEIDGIEDYASLILPRKTDVFMIVSLASGEAKTFSQAEWVALFTDS